MLDGASRKSSRESRGAFYFMERKTISNHFLHVERVQAAAAAGRSIAEYSRLLQLAAAHDRYFPGLDDVVDESDSEPDDDDADDWGYVNAMADY